MAAFLRVLPTRWQCVSFADKMAVFLLVLPTRWWRVSSANKMAAFLRVLPTRWRRGRFAYKMAAMQNKQNVNKNNVEYILRLLLVRVTWPLHGHLGWHYNDYRLPLVIVMTTGRPPTRSAFDNAQRHVTAFRPISEAVRSWSCDIGLSDVGAQLAG